MRDAFLERGEQRFGTCDVLGPRCSEGIVAQVACPRLGRSRSTHAVLAHLNAEPRDLAHDFCPLHLTRSCL